MINKLIIFAGLLTAATSQAPPPPVLLTTTKSGVIPIAPTPFPGFETNEGALINGGPPVIGFTGPGGNASVQSNLPAATYTAMLPATNFDNLTGSTITGSVSASSMQGSSGVMFMINFTGFPDAAKYGPFVYHIHALPITGGNCSTSMGHLDPTNRGELHACEDAAPPTCQAGDLSGKHGNITGTSFSASFTDLYLSTDPSSPYFFGDKSIVIHTNNATRLTCANFMMASSSGANGTTGTNATGSPTTSGGGSGSSSSTAMSGATRGYVTGSVATLTLVSAFAFLLL